MISENEGQVWTFSILLAVLDRSQMLLVHEVQYISVTLVASFWRNKDVYWLVTIRFLIRCRPEGLNIFQNGDWDVSIIWAVVIGFRAATICLKVPEKLFHAVPFSQRFRKAGQSCFFIPHLK